MKRYKRKTMGWTKLSQQTSTRRKRLRMSELGYCNILVFHYEVKTVDPLKYCKQCFGMVGVGWLWEGGQEKHQFLAI